MVVLVLLLCFLTLTTNLLPGMSLSQEAASRAAKIKTESEAALGPADMSRHIKVDLGHRGIKLVHMDPPIFTIDGFFTDQECEKLGQNPSTITRGHAFDSHTLTSKATPMLTTSETTRYISAGTDGEESGDSYQVASATFGGAATASNRRSTTWYLKYEKATELVGKAMRLLPGVELENCEEPQVPALLPRPSPASMRGESRMTHIHPCWKTHRRFARGCGRWHGLCVLQTILCTALV
jgi:hypothetical protein